MIRNFVPLLLSIAVLPASGAEVVRVLTIADLGLPAEATADGFYLADPAVAGGEMVIEGWGKDRFYLIRLPAPGPVKGIVALYREAEKTADGQEAKPATGPAAKPKRLSFSVSQQAFMAAPDGSERMHTEEAKSWHYLLSDRSQDGRSSSLLPESIDRGTRAWWALRLEQATGKAAKPDPDERRRRRNGDLDETIDLFTGLTALNENLQFDRRLAIRGEGESTVALDSLPTLQTKEIPWERMPGAKDAAKPVIDLLAERIPVDQHAVFFPSFPALVTAVRQADETLSGPVQILAGHGADSGTQSRYQRQLGLELNELSKRFGAQVVDQVAFTGSDPFLRVGADVAVLLHAKQPALLASYLTLKQQALIQAGAVASNGTLGKLAWRAAVSADRALSCYVLNDGDITVIANSLAQLEAYAAVRSGGRPALATAPELAFFRRRYVADANELALAVVSDATIRRWCSARWRIGDSRRTRAQAVMTSMQAEWIAAGCLATWTPADAPADLGTITIGANGVRSSVYGSLAFMTPIAELDLAKVTAAEAESFKRFLEGYQRAWRDFFDPIAIRLQTTSDGRMGVDLSVLPLIVGSEFREVFRLVGKASLAVGAADRHPALVQYAIALDPQGGLLAEAEGNFGGLLGGIASPLGWVGNAASIYAEADPVWAELVKARQESDRFGFNEFSQFAQKNLSRFPVGANIAVRDPLKLAVFLTGIRALADQSAPGLVTWGTRMWKGITYVSVTPSKQGQAEIDAKLFYLPAPEGLTVTLNEELMHRAIDRLVTAREALAAGKPHPALPWPGEQMAASVQPPFLAQLSELRDGRGGGGVSAWMMGRMWNDINILNEWHRLFPKEDPLAVHERLWNTRLVCPFGGTYRWNEKWLSMEATEVGAPDDSREPATVPAAFATIAALAAGIGFDELPSLDEAKPAEPTNDTPRGRRNARERVSIGLRARIEITPAPVKP